MVSVERCRFPEIGVEDFEGRFCGDPEFVVFQDEQVADVIVAVRQVDFAESFCGEIYFEQPQRGAGVHFVERSGHETIGVSVAERFRSSAFWKERRDACQIVLRQIDIAVVEGYADGVLGREADVTGRKGPPSRFVTADACQSFGAGVVPEESLTSCGDPDRAVRCEHDLGDIFRDPAAVVGL